MKFQLLIVLFTTFVSLSLGQTSPPASVTTRTPEGDESPIKVNTYLVNIPVITSNRDGHYVSGLTKDNFNILQNGLPQPIEFFADGKSPMNVMILIDTSPSTISFMGDIQDAARNFVKGFRPGDKGLIACFGADLGVLSLFTSDQKQLSKAIGQIGRCSTGGSNMQDAVYKLVTRGFASTQGRKALIVLTDGMVSGTISNEDLSSVLAESDVLVYSILFQRKWTPAYAGIIKLPTGEKITREEMIKRVEQNQNSASQFMTSLSRVTGGRLYNKDSSDFKVIFQNIADELKNYYLIGFYPLNIDDGKPHQFTVEVNPKTLVIRTKRNIQLKIGSQK